MGLRASSIGALALTAAIAAAALACGSDRRFTAAPARTSLGVQTVELPVSRCGTRFIVQATVEGAGPFRFLLDTGSSVTLLGSNVANAANLRSLPGGGVIRYTYDRNGNLASVAPPGHPAHGFSYTPANLVAKRL